MNDTRPTHPMYLHTAINALERQREHINEAIEELRSGTRDFLEDIPQVHLDLTGESQARKIDPPTAPVATRKPAARRVSAEQRRAMELGFKRYLARKKRALKKGR